MTLNELRWRCFTAVGCLCRSFLAVGSPQEEMIRRGAAVIGLSASCFSRMLRRCGSTAKVLHGGMTAKFGKSSKPRPVDFIVIFLHMT